MNYYWNFFGRKFTYYCDILSLPIFVMIVEMGDAAF